MLKRVDSRDVVDDVIRSSESWLNVSGVVEACPRRGTTLAIRTKLFCVGSPTGAGRDMSM